MKITSDFQGGNITILKIDGNHIYLERDLRDTEGDWFYWAFKVEGAENQTLVFHFPKTRIGRFGAAYSKDFYMWDWTNNYYDDTFTFTFSENDHCVYFAHHILYPVDRFSQLLHKYQLTSKTLSKSEKGTDIPYLRVGNAKKTILLTSGHHACESTGMYVLEGALDYLIPRLPSDLQILAVPFVDLDGVLDGDQGKNRIPYDHNRDYPLDDSKHIYPQTQAILDIVKQTELTLTLDFHSPWHMGSINDTIFFSKPSNERRLPVFTKILKENTSKDKLKYKGETDVDGFTSWNSPSNPSFKNRLCQFETNLVCSTMEITYFGLPGEEVSIPDLLILGHSIGKSILDFLFL